MCQAWITRRVGIATAESGVVHLLWSKVHSMNDQLAIFTSVSSPLSQHLSNLRSSRLNLLAICESNEITNPFRPGVLLLIFAVAYDAGEVASGSNGAAQNCLFPE